MHPAAKQRDERRRSPTAELASSSFGSAEILPKAKEEEEVVEEQEGVVIMQEGRARRESQGSAKGEKLFLTLRM